MKKILVILTLGITLVLASCLQLRIYQVSFDTKGGNEIAAIDVKASRQLNEVPEPKKDGFVFDGWYLDENYQNVFKIETFTVTSNTKLYAKWIYDLTSSVSYEIKNNILSWDSSASLFEVSIGGQIINIDKSEINLEMHALNLMSTTHIQVFEKNDLDKKLILSIKVVASNKSIAYKLDHQIWNETFKGDNVEVKTVGTKAELRLTLKDAKDDVPYIQTLEKGFYSKLDLTAYSQHAVHDIKVSYSVDGLTFTDLETKTLTQKPETLTYIVPKDIEVYIRIELVKDQRNQTSNRFIALQNIILYGNKEGYQINEIQEGNQ